MARWWSSMRGGPISANCRPRFARGGHDRLPYYAFDLLSLDGQDLRKTPQVERKIMLQGAVRHLPARTAGTFSTSMSRVMDRSCSNTLRSSITRVLSR